MPSKEMFEMRQEIKKIIETIGLWNIPKTHMAEKYHVSRPTLDRHIKKIIRGWPKDSIEETKLSLQNSYKNSIKKAEQILADNTSTKGELLQAGRTIALLNKEYTLMLEAYGEKPKIASEIKVSGNARLSIEDVKKVLEEVP